MSDKEQTTPLPWEGQGGGSEIIDPIPVDILKKELKQIGRLRVTNKSGNEIYIFDWKNGPYLLREVGRLREEAFRAAGGGTGKPLDLDHFDTCPNPYQQLIVWDPEAEKIIGGYRYMFGSECDFDDNGQPLLATSHMFRFSGKFIRDYLPYTLELGRSFVSLEYQSTRAGVKAIFSLDNLWDGIGAVSIVKPNVRYFFGKMTMYPSYNRRCRDLILYFLKKYFEDKDRLILPITPLKLEHSEEELAAVFSAGNFRDDYRILNREVRANGLNIPPLVNTYMNLSPTMKLFGTAINDGFGDVEETGILITIDEMLDDKYIRHIESFAKEHPEYIKLTSGANKVISEYE